MRAAIVAVVAILAVLAAAALMPDTDTERCVIPGHARTTVVQCEQP